MPRANRYIIPGQIYHVTHRCHDHEFLLKFARDRDLYRAMLRERLKRFPISLLGYCLTSNHTHLLLKVGNGETGVLARFMQSLEGDFAQAYNLRKKRFGAYWCDRYHAVMVEQGEYLWRCLRYIDLNMVRAGVVRTPADWPWCGYQEMAGKRLRYRLLDREALASELAPVRCGEEIVRDYLQTVDDALRKEPLVREPCWTGSLAVGSEGYVKAIGARIPNRMKVETRQQDNVWVVRETSSLYGGLSGPKSDPKTPGTACSRAKVLDAL